MSDSIKIINNLSLKDIPNELWKDIPDYKGLYQVSSLGRVKSLSKKIERLEKGSYWSKERILKQIKPPTMSYYKVNLYKKGVVKRFETHVLVAIAFLNHIPCGHTIVIDHKDNNKINNKENNLQLITQNKNALKGSKEYCETGIYHSKNKNGYVVDLFVSGIQFTGVFSHKKDAIKAKEILK